MCYVLVMLHIQVCGVYLVHQAHHILRERRADPYWRRHGFFLQRPNSVWLHGGEWACCYGSATRRVLRGPGTSVRKFSARFIWAHVIWETITKFCMVIKQYLKKIFTGSTTPRALGKNFCHRNADARSVCGS